MVVPLRRYRIRQASRRRGPYVSLRKDLGRERVSTPKIPPFWRAYLQGLVLFMLCFGMAFPYRYAQRIGFIIPQLPDERGLATADIKVLRAEATLPETRSSKGRRAQLWEVPNVRYELKEGESLSLLADRYGLDLGTLLSFNQIADLSKVKGGTLLRLPELDGQLYRPRLRETLAEIVQGFDLSSAAVLYYNPSLSPEGGNLVFQGREELFLPGGKMTEASLRQRARKVYLFPLIGPVQQGFGPYTDPLTQVEAFHEGVDIKGRVGDPVRAAQRGRVSSTGFNSSYGNFVILSHPGGYSSLYAHLQKIMVKSTDKVEQGEIIAVVGQTGYAPTPHLHFSLLKGKTARDPLAYLY